jgi:hypothetical protein
LIFGLLRYATKRGSVLVNPATTRANFCLEFFSSFFFFLFLIIMSSAFVLESRNKTSRCLFRSHEDLLRAQRSPRKIRSSSSCLKFSTLVDILYDERTFLHSLFPPISCALCTIYLSRYTVRRCACLNKPHRLSVIVKCSCSILPSLICPLSAAESSDAAIWAVDS